MNISLNKNIILKENLLFSASIDIEQICDVLYSSSIINFTSYKRTYKTENKFFCLGGTNDFNIHSCQYGFFTDAVQLNKIKSKYTNSDFFCYFIKEDNHVLQKEAKKFNITNVFVVVKEYPDYFESMSFGSSNNALIGFCFNNLSRLISFKEFFLEKTKCFVDKVNENVVTLLSYNDLLKQANNCACFNPYFNKKDKAIELKLTEFLSNNNINITNREILCLYYFLIGFSSKQIAINIGNISYRTVEKHIENIRRKVGISDLRNEFKCFTHC